MPLAPGTDIVTTVPLTLPLRLILPPVLEIELVPVAVTPLAPTEMEASELKVRFPPTLDELTKTSAALALVTVALPLVVLIVTLPAEIVIGPMSLAPEPVVFKFTVLAVMLAPPIGVIVPAAAVAVMLAVPEPNGRLLFKTTEPPEMVTLPLVPLMVPTPAPVLPAVMLRL